MYLQVFEKSSLFKINLHDKRRLHRKSDMYTDQYKAKIAVVLGNGALGQATDEQTIRGFLSGTDCLKGVSDKFMCIRSFY